MCTNLSEIVCSGEMYWTTPLLSRFCSWFWAALSTRVCWARWSPCNCYFYCISHMIASRSHRLAIDRNCILLHGSTGNTFAPVHVASPRVSASLDSYCLFRLISRSLSFVNKVTFRDNSSTRLFILINLCISLVYFLVILSTFANSENTLVESPSTLPLIVDSR